MNAPNKLALGALAVFFLLSTFVHSQAVSLMPIPEQQFFTATGAVCSGCFVYTYQSGTYTPQASYTDYSGLYANTNPIVLNSGGFPATAAGAQVAIWLTPSVLYRIVVQNAAHVQLYQIDGIGGTAQTFNGPVSILSTSNQLIMGATGFTTTLNFPAPASSITLNLPVTADTLVGRATTDTLTNKTLTSPVINTPTVNSVQMLNSPGAYVAVANSSSTGTTLATLTILTGAPSQALIAPITATAGAIGICIAQCGTTGNAMIQQSGSSSCLFDGSTTAGDYVAMSTTTAGYCHDVGTTYSTTGQLIGRVTVTGVGSAVYALILFGPEIRSTTIGGTPTIAAGSGAGSSPTVSFFGASRDKGGVVVLTTGTGPGVGALFTVTYSAAFSTGSTCTFSPSNAAAAGISSGLDVGATASTWFMNQTGSILAASTAYQWSYTCNGF